MALLQLYTCCGGKLSCNVVYVQKPQKLRHLLGQYGELDRVYCAPEDPSVRKARKRNGGNTGKSFTEGWVEFEDKKVAKRVVAMLNGNAIGGKRRSAYHYDLWNLKYLPKFKWDQLTEEIAYQNAVREQKLATEISAAKRERDFYLSRVDKSRALMAMQERQQKREAATADDAAGANEPPAPDKYRLHKRSYGQRKAKPDPATDGEAPLLSSDLLALIAGG
eukprot:jgi/Astpho2/6664/Aster-05021